MGMGLVLEVFGGALHFQVRVRARMGVLYPDSSPNPSPDPAHNPNTNPDPAPVPNHR